MSRGGHDIPDEDIRRRYKHSRFNLTELVPILTSLRVFDNSPEADPESGTAPNPALVLHMERGEIMGPPDLTSTPVCAKAIVAAAIKASNPG